MKFFFLGLFLLIASGCNPMGGEKLKVTWNNPSAFKDLNAQVATVSVVNNQLVITGSTLAAIKTATLKNNSQQEIFQVESASDSQIIANGAKAISIIAGSVFDLILADAYGSATFQVAFTIADGSVTAAKLSSMGAATGQILKWNGTNWAPANSSISQIYLGGWNANTNTPALADATTPASGEYYIVTTAGTKDLGGGVLVSYLIGDWVMSNGSSWDKISSNSLSGAGTTNYIPYYSSSSVLANSPMYISGSSVGIGTTTPGSTLDLKGTLRLSGATSGYVGFIPPAVAGSTTYTLPSADGSVAGQVLSTNATGTLSWITPSTSAAPSGSAGGDLSGTYPSPTITGLGATKIADGSVTNAQFQYLSGVTSNIQTQLTAKQSSGNFITELNGDVTAIGPGIVAATIAQVGGVSAATIAAGVGLANQATNTNTVSTTVKRDASGNFSAGTITATLSGTATNVTGTVAIANGGTAGTTAIAARANLGLVIGSGLGEVMVFTTSMSCFPYEKLQVSAAPYFLTCVTDNGNTNYALLAGRASGQSLKGGTAASETLTLESTSNATKGYVLLNPNGGNVGIGTSAPQAQFDVGGNITSTSVSTMSPISYISGNTNALTGVEMRNANSGASADFRFVIGDDTRNNYIAFAMPGSGNIGTLFGQTRSNIAPIFSNVGTGGGSVNGRILALGTVNNNGVLFGSNNLERMRITASGNVGIGTTTPSPKFYVTSDSTLSGTATTAIGADAPGITSTDYALFLRAKSGAGTANNLMVVRGDGNVGIGITTPGALLHVGSATVASATVVAKFQNIDGTCSMTPAAAGSGIACSSDERLKTDIDHVSGDFALERILKLQAVTYRFKKDENENRHTGYIAQQIKKVAPEFVRQNDDGFFQVYYDGFIPWITEAIKEMNTRLTGLFKVFEGHSRDIASVKADNAQIKTRVDRTEKEYAEIKTRADKAEKENAELKARFAKIEKILMKK